MLHLFPKGLLEKDILFKKIKFNFNRKVCYKVSLNETSSGKVVV